jgi:hypothetical protein
MALESFFAMLLLCRSRGCVLFSDDLLEVRKRRTDHRLQLVLQNADGVVSRVANVEYPVHPHQLEKGANRF